MAHENLLKNIDGVYAAGLCTQCGTCYSFCPKDNIRMKCSSTGDFIFYIKDRSECAGCSICYRVCPGHTVDFDALNTSMFSKISEDKYLGNYRTTFLAQSLSEKVRKVSASGGVVSSLLISALNSGLIKGALVVKMNGKRPLEPEIFVARNEEEILSAAQSKYLPVPMNVGIREILDDNGKFASVGLPCHIHGIRKAECVFPKLREKIAFCIGLFCIHSASFLMTDYLIKKARIRMSNVSELRYRDKQYEGKWPGGMRIATKSEEEKYIPYKSYQYAHRLFALARCNICPDFSNELADISLGDAHLSEFWRGEGFLCSQGSVLRGEEGWNLGICRTHYGEALLKQAVDSKIVKVIDINPGILTKSQRAGLYYKKHSFFARMGIHKALGYKLPLFNGIEQRDRLSVMDYVKPLISFLIQHVSNTRVGSFIIRIIPQKVLMKKLRFKQELTDMRFGRVEYGSHVSAAK